MKKTIRSKKPKEVIPIAHESIVSPSPKFVEKTLSDTTDPGPAQPTQTKHWYGFTALIILCIILLGSTIFFYFENQGKSPDQVVNIDTAKSQRNTQEKLLQDAFDHAGDTLVLSDSVFKSPILISDTLRIKRDSLFVIAKGMILQADSNYNGPALVIHSQTKITGLDSLQFKGFKTAISLSNTRLLLKGVSFVNCINPVLNNYSFSNQPSVTVDIKTVASKKAN